MSKAIIKVENLSKKYTLGQVHTNLLSEKIGRWFKRNANQADSNSKEEFWALKDVSFEVQQGDVVGIIGRNGAGKSTLLKILSRITAPTSGKVEMFGRVASLLEVGTGFHPELTGRENIFLNGAILGMSKAEVKSKFDEIVSFAEIEKFIDTPVKRYSSGMYVRLAFAVAAHLEPEILIVDEVLAVGDAEFQKKCLGKIQDISGQSRTVLFVSHNMNAVRSLCKHVILLKDGEIVENGEASSVIELYLSPYEKINTTQYNVCDWYRHPNLLKYVEFIHLELCTKNGTIRLNADEDILFRFKIKANRNVINYNIGILIMERNGTPVGLCFSKTNLTACADEIHHILFKFKKLRLAPGIYRCVLSLGKGNEFVERINYDVISDVLIFEVMPISDEDGRLMRWSSAWGRIILPEPIIEELHYE